MDDKNEIDSSIQHNLKIITSSNVLDREPKESLKEEKSISINTETETGDTTKQNLMKDESGFNDTEQKDMATQSDNDDGSIIERNKMDTKEDDKSKVIKNTIFSSLFVNRSFRHMYIIQQTYLWGQQKPKKKTFLMF